MFFIAPVSSILFNIEMSPVNGILNLWIYVVDMFQSTVQKIIIFCLNTISGEGMNDVVSFWERGWGGVRAKWAAVLVSKLQNDWNCWNMDCKDVVLQQTQRKYDQYQTSKVDDGLKAQFWKLIDTYTAHLTAVIQSAHNSIRKLHSWFTQPLFSRGYLGASCVWHLHTEKLTCNMEQKSSHYVTSENIYCKCSIQQNHFFLPYFRRIFPLID